MDVSIFAESFAGGLFGQSLSGAELALPARVNGLAGSLLVSVRRFDASPSVGGKRRIRKLVPAEMARVRAAVAHALETGVRMPEIAAAVGLSPSQFSRAFHATAQETFSAFVLRIRIDTAMRLMIETDLPLYHIACESGFGDQSNFSRSFAKHAGVTPYKWRLLMNERRNDKFRAASAVERDGNP
jgi:AraC family transcriptional regulator